MSDDAIIDDFHFAFWHWPDGMWHRCHWLMPIVVSAGTILSVNQDKGDEADWMVGSRVPRLRSRRTYLVPPDAAEKIMDVRFKEGALMPETSGLLAPRVVDRRLSRLRRAPNGSMMMELQVVYDRFIAYS